MKANTLGVNEEKISKLVLDINEYLDKIDQTFNYMEETVDQVSTSFQCDAGEKFQSQFNETKKNFKIVHNNIASYSNDLIQVKSNYQTMETLAANDINAATVNKYGKE